MGRDPKASPQSKKAEAELRLARSAMDLAGTQSEPAHSGGLASRAVAAALLPFLLRDDGWLRASPENDGATVYWKWKFSRGKHRNHYVMAVYPATESAQALLVLASKVDAVDRGEKAPVKDHYFER